MDTLGSVASVIAAIREEVEAEVGEAERRLAADVGRVEAAAPVDEGGEAREVLLAAARRRAREQLGHEDWLDRRAALEAREAWMQRVAAEARRRLTEEPDPVRRREALLRAAREAVARLPAGELVLAVSPQDAGLLDAAAVVALGDGTRSVRLVADAAVAPAGCVVRTADDKLAIDEGVEARARRLEAAWRAALGEVYGA